VTCNPALSSCTGATVSGVIGDSTNSIYGDKVILYLTMRRGGSFIYAVDVTNPASPKLLWRKVRGASDSAGWDELGQSWSEPKIVKLSVSMGNANNPDNVALIFGAGYQRGAEDTYPCLLDSATTTNVVKKAVGSGSVVFTSSGSCTITGRDRLGHHHHPHRGRGIMVVDAMKRQRRLAGGRGLTTIRHRGRAQAERAGHDLRQSRRTSRCSTRTATAIGDRIYVGDTCGQVWRGDIAKPDMDEWTVTKIASVWTGAATVISGKRKFLFPARSRVRHRCHGQLHRGADGQRRPRTPFDAIVQDRFYMIKDRDSSDPGNPQAGTTNSSSVKISGFATAPTGAVVADADLFDATTTALVDGTDPQGLNGWKVTLAAGEKVVSNATSVAGTTFFNTNQPSAVSSGTCGSNLGIAREYAVGFADAAATIDLNASGSITIADRFQVHAGGGYLPSPVAVVVEIDGKKYQAVISGTSVQTPPGLTLDKRTRVYWYKEIE
jgi:type IV pilus assembly protein PilY1